MTQLAFQGITKSFGTVRAPRDVTFSVAEGETHTFESICGCPREPLGTQVAGHSRRVRGRRRISGQWLSG
jgi:ABC-type uncharacterized transport system ATPase subunit